MTEFDIKQFEAYRKLEHEVLDLRAENRQLKEEYKDYEYLKSFTEQVCKCDMRPPWNTCIQCKAAHALNECGEIIGDAIREIEQVLK